MRRLSPRMRLVVVGFAVLIVALASSLADAASACKKAGGKFTLTSVTGPDCLSAVDVCATGIYTGTLAGTTVFTGSSLLQTVDTPTTGVVLLTGDDVFTTKDGGLMTKDAIVLHTTGAGEFAEVDTLISGTGEWAGANGVITAQGTFTQGAGGAGTYAGEICMP